MSTPREPTPSDFRIHAANLIVSLKEFRFDRLRDEDRGKHGNLAAELIAESAPLAKWLEFGDHLDQTQVPYDVAEARRATLYEDSTEDRP